MPTWQTGRNQTECGWRQSVATWSEAMTEGRRSHEDEGDLRSQICAPGRSAGGTERADPLFQPSNGTSTHTRDAVVPSADAVTIAQDHGFGVADFASLRAIQRSSQILPDVHHLYALLRSR